jgi:hypothetical protein
MAIIGPAVKAARRIHSGRRQVRVLDQAINRAQSESSRAVLDGFCGAQRFDAAQVFLDGTLAKRLDEAPDERDRWFDLYLNKLFQEYQMAAEELKRITASRGEIVALGIAVKEIALTLDRNLESFRRDADHKFREGLRDVRAQAARELAEARAEQLEHLRKMDARLDTMVARQQQFFGELNTTLQQGRRWLYAGLTASGLALMIAIIASSI